MGGYDFRETLALFSPGLSWAAPLTPQRAASPCLTPEMPHSHFCCPHRLCALPLLLPLCLVHHYSKSVSSHARQFVLPHSCEALDTQKQNVNAVYELVIKADVVLVFHMDAAENIAYIFSKNMTVNSSETTSFAFMPSNV